MTIQNLPTLVAAREHLQSASSHRLIDWYLHERGVKGVRVLSRKDFNPIEVRHLMPSLVILDIADPSNPTFRLAGTKYTSFLGVDPTGKSYLDFVPESRWPAVVESYTHCRDHRCAMITHTVAVDGKGHERNIEIVNLPFWKDGEAEGTLHLVVLVSLRNDERWAIDERLFSRFISVDFRAFVDLGEGVPDTFRGNPINCGL